MPVRFFGAWKGHLMVDDYVSYEAMFMFTFTGNSGFCIGLAYFPMSGESSSAYTKPTGAR